MIKVTSIHNEKDEVCGFRVEGHAGYAKKGQDIICSAVSVLATNTVNSVEALTNDKFSCKQAEDGFLELILVEDVSKESKLLLDSFFLGIEAIVQEYGNKFVNLLK
ncbi:MAG: ribosomal-processing cysteine protease Prp [Lachnospiraceae bacterium]|nr:ribosomal-processing cysteine protease Prp [Lachnospiraceae bacterium]